MSTAPTEPNQAHRGNFPWAAVLGKFTVLLLLFLLVIVLPLVWFTKIITYLPTPTLTTNNQAAIVVLTGERARLSQGAALLRAGAGKYLFISGVYHANSLNELAPILDLPAAQLACCVQLGYAAADTFGNAQEATRWLATSQPQLTSIILVTTNYHLPRALLEFRMAAPHINLIGYPVLHDNLQPSGWWRPATWWLLAEELPKYLLARLRALLASSEPPPAPATS